MTSKACILKVLSRERPEWVPTFEWLIDHRIREALCPPKRSSVSAGGGLSKTDDELDFIEWAGWDGVVVYADEHPDTDGKQEYLDEWGLTHRHTVEEYPVVIGHRFERLEELDDFVPPDPSAPWHYRSLSKVKERFGDEKAVVFRLRDAYSLPRYLLGMEPLLMSMITAPEFVHRLVDISIDYYTGMARIAAELGADVFWTSDDYCDNRGPVMGPGLWRTFCLPGLRRLAGEVRELGRPFIKHCDGNINPILDDLVEAGIDCIDPVDVNAGVDLADIKARYGDRIAIKGGVPVSLLCDGTPGEVRRSVEACLGTAGPEGYILSSSSDITASVKPENYAALLDAWCAARGG